MTASIELTGGRELAMQLLLMERNLRAAVEKEAVTEANKLIQERLKKNVPGPNSSGALQRSIAHKVKLYDSNIAVGIVGPSNDFTGNVTRSKGQLSFKRGERTGKKSNFRRPANYAHLVEGGTTTRKTKAGKNRGAVAPLPFTAFTLETVQAEVQKIFEKHIKQAIN